MWRGRLTEGENPLPHSQAKLLELASGKWVHPQKLCLAWVRGWESPRKKPSLAAGSRQGRRWQPVRDAGHGCILHPFLLL